MADSRTCDQCGSEFMPRREHARFCSAGCRVAWNQQHAGNVPVTAGILDWSVTAMRQATGRLRRAPGWDRQGGFLLITDAVWWVTIVDATLVRYRPGEYAGLLDSQPDRDRQAIEETFAGLRFVRNQMTQEGLARFLDPGPVPAAAAPAGTAATVASWAWLAVPEPAMAALSRRSQQWELERYRAYGSQLAGRPVGQAFGRATAFLRQASKPAPVAWSGR